MTERHETPWEATDPNGLPTQPWTSEGLTEAAEEAGFSVGPPELTYSDDRIEPDPAVEPEPAGEDADESEAAEPAIRLDFVTTDPIAWDALFDASVRAAATREPAVEPADEPRAAEDAGSDADDRWWLEPDGATTGEVSEVETVRAEVEEATAEEPRPVPAPTFEPAPIPAAPKPSTPPTSPAPPTSPTTPDLPAPFRSSGAGVMDRYMTPTFGVREPPGKTARTAGDRVQGDHQQTPGGAEQERVFSPPGAAVPDVPAEGPRPPMPEARLRADSRKRAVPPTIAVSRPTTPRGSAAPSVAGPVADAEPDRLVSRVMTGASLVVVVFLVVGFLVIFTDLL